MSPDEHVAHLLRTARTIAVVGLSSNPMRPSYGVTEYMQRAGYRVLPVNPNETEVLGERAYPDLASLPVKPDIVNVFRRPDEVRAVVDQAILTGAQAIWMQLGVSDPAAAARARAAGIQVIEDKCIMVEHRRLLEGGL